jgi:endonuclease/exonuclease/phosphatase family metal-dependent hydrolase
VRLATFNILSGRSPDDGLVDERRFARAVASLDADLLALQEVDRNQPRSRRFDLTAIAAEAMDAKQYRFAAAVLGTPGGPWSLATGDEQPDSTAYGVALLSRFPVLGWKTCRLPPLPLRVPYRFDGRLRPAWVRDEPRVAVVADVDTPLGVWTVAGTHLSYLPWWNRLQLRSLVSALADVAGPLVLMGDLNMAPKQAHRLTRMRPLATGATFPASSPQRQIDHILMRGDLRPTVGGPRGLPVSDHRALVADIG